jgi:hypothetical protein
MGSFDVMRAGLILGATLLAVSGGLTALAGEPGAGGRTIDASRALDAGPAGPLPVLVMTRTLPDPPALVERSEWVFDLEWDRGQVWLRGTHAFNWPAPQPTPRVMGRFALELFEGAALIERVRFDFPLLGAALPDASISFEPKLRTRIGVVFPRAARGTRLELCDRATGRRWAMPWPPPPPSPLGNGRRRRLRQSEPDGT